MNFTFIGGGSLRLLPIIRGIFAKAPETFRNGEIRLMDLKLERAEAVGKLVLACPEYQHAGCKVIWTNILEDALRGTDVVYITMGARRNPTESQAMFLANSYGYHASDNLSVNGAFLSLRIGRVIFNIAQAMEKCCPEALMLIFSNPVAVYSHLVNIRTKIRALGICGGFNNHKYDLTRLTGRDEYDDNWDVVAAGINHMSFIIRGAYKGKDIFSEVLPRYLTDDWKPIQVASPDAWVVKSISFALTSLYQLYRRYGTTIFSTELDGLAHIFPEESSALMIDHVGTGKDFDAAASGRRFVEAERKSFAEFIAMSATPEKVDWKARGGLYGKSETDITIPICQALTGTKKMRIMASRPNSGAVKDLGDEMPLEYTIDIFGKKLTPVGNQYIPAPFYGLVDSLADFQRLQSEAIAAWDAEIFANALEAYPVHRFSLRRKEFFKLMFEIYTDLDPHMLEAKKYFLNSFQ